jgi:hypothetical protein
MVISNIYNVLKKGKNFINIISEVPNYPDLVPSYHGIEPIFLRGSFLVKGANKIIKIPDKPIKGVGDWSKNGFLYFSGGINFRTEFNLPDIFSECKIILEFPNIRESVRLFVNNEECGECAWQPFHFDLTGRLKKGKNLMRLYICNTAENFFTKPIPSGLLKPGVLKIFE